jgi:crotonobetainyl-CoA:carnitine CoA-transferase CaiB-like acyl-CoA transferase
VVDNYRAGVAERLGIGHARLVAANPMITSVSISAFGEEGPLGRRPGFDPVVQAMSGVMRAQGGSDEADSPAFLTVPINDVLAAGLGALGACASLYAAPRIGVGQQVSVTLLASSCLLQSGYLVRFPGAPPPPAGGRDFAGPGPADRLYRCTDGWIRLGEPDPPGQAALVRAGLATIPSASGDAADLTTAVAAALAGLPVAEALRRAAAAGIAAVRARRPQELTGDAELIRRGMLAVIETDAAGVSRVGPGRWLEMPGLVLTALGEAPAAGEHQRAVMAALNPAMTDAESAHGR